jgi:hypothetical protein
MCVAFRTSWRSWIVVAAAVVAGTACDGGGAGGRDAAGETDAAAEVGASDADAATGDADARADGDADDSADAANDLGPEADGGDTDVSSGDVADGADAQDAAGDAEIPVDPAISAELIPVICAEQCAKVMATCGTLAGVGDDDAGCETACVERVGQDPAWAASYACQVLACDAGTCFPPGGPLPAVPGCGSFCQRVAACGDLDALSVPAGELGLCTSYCAGRAALSPSGPAVVECANLTLAAGSCGPDAILSACGLPVLGCPNLCERFYAPFHPDHCVFGRTFVDTWPKVGDCIAACTGIVGGSQPQFFGCLIAVECGDPTPCLGVTATVAPSCLAACEAGLGLCKGMYAGLAGATFCAGACTGAFRDFSVGPGNPNAATCVTAAGICPDPAAETRHGVIGLAACAAEISPACDAACSPLDQCLDSLTGRRGCVEGCTQLETDNPPVVQQITQCIQGAGGDCAKLESCVPQ